MIARHADWTGIVEATFPLIAFTADTVARLTGLFIAQLHHWDRSGFFVPSFADPERRRPYSRIYSYADVVGLRTIAKLRQHGVSWPELKKVRTLFARASNDDWANRRLYVVGNRVFFTHENAVLAAKPLGQRVDLVVLPVDKIARSVRQAIDRLGERDRDQIGEVVTDRFIMGGVPIVAGTRIPTATIAWFAQNGYDVEAIRREFSRLENADIEAALAFEGVAGQSPTRPLAAVG